MTHSKGALVNTEDKVDKLWADMYEDRGKGNPSITTRLVLVEDAITRFGNNSSRIVWALVAVALSIVGDLIVHIVIATSGK